MSKSVWLILGLGIIVRLIIAASTYHPDFRTFQYAGAVMAGGDILNLYDYINEIGDPQIRQDIIFNYPPAIYLFFGIYSFLVVKVLHVGLLNDFLIAQPDFFGNIWFNLHLLLVKVPYLFFDLPCAFLLANLFDNQRQKIWAFSLWMFNPVNLFATYMIGQFDVIPVFWTIYCLVLVKQKKVALAALMLGLGIAFKLYPVYLLIALALVKERWLERVKLVLIGTTPYILTILPFLPSTGYRASGLVAEQSLKSFYAQLPVSGGEAILLFPASLILIYLWLFYHPVRLDQLWKVFLVVLSLFFILTHTHPQWLLWLTPFLIISLIKSKFKEGILMIGIIVSWLGLLFLFDQSLSVGLFAPIWPALYNGLSLWEMIKITPDTTWLRSIWQSLFVAVVSYLIYLKLSDPGIPD